MAIKIKCATCGEAHAAREPCAAPAEKAVSHKTAKFDRAAYQKAYIRDYMRAYRARKKLEKR